MKKVTIICPVHQPTDIRIFKKEAMSLVNAGYKVSIIAKECSGLIIKNNNITVIGLNYKNRFYRFMSIPKIIFIALKERADIYHIHNPDTLPIGLVLKLLKRKVIYDTHENFRKKILLRIWIPKSLRRLTAYFIFYSEKLCSYTFDATIVTQEEQLREYTRSHLIGNSPLKSLRNDFNVNQSIEGVIKLVYVGGISEDRGLRHMLKLNYFMNNIRPTQLCLIGPPINSLTIDSLIAITNDHDNVSYHGSLPQEVAFEIVKSSDYGLILLDDVADYRDTSPNKLFEYMMLGTPFIATEFPKWQKLLNKENAGFFIPVEEICFALASKIIDERVDIDGYTNMAKSGIKFVNEKYNWSICDEPQLIKLYQNLLEV